MKFSYLLRLAICTFALWGINGTAHAQAYPLSVVTTITSPYPLRFSDYEAFQNQVVISINRATQDQREYRFYFRVRLENMSNGNSLSSRQGIRPAEAIVLPQGVPSIFLTGADVEALQNGLRLSDFDVQGFNPSSGDQVLPEGTYSFCLTAHNFNTAGIDPDVQLSDEDQGCGMFPVNYYLQPVITQPFDCPTTIDIDDDQNMYIAWATPGLSSTDDVEYKLYFTTVPDGMPDNVDPLQIINNSALPPLVVQAPFEGVNNYFMDVAAGAEPPIVPGLRYVVRIQATSNTLAFQNNGFSDPCMIIVRGGDENAEGFSFEADYPNGGTIPFKQFPVITKMAPYDEDYKRFEYRTVFRQESGVAITQAHEYKEDNNWPDGPVRGQGLSGYPDEIARLRACYLPVYAAPSEAPPPMVLQHGADYSWFMSGTVINDDNTRQSDEVVSETFQYGMPEPMLQTPADNARFQVNEGITFVWNTGEAPEKLFPTIPDIVRRSGSGSNASTREFHYGPVDERYVLQISRNEDFTELVTTATRSEALTLAAFQLNDAAEAQAKRDLIYKMVNSGTTPLQFSEGTYWWRVGWLQDPANQSSAFYQTSPTRKFCVGASADCNTTAQNGGNNTPAQTGCLADCNAPEITDRTAVAREVDDEVTVGKFEMTIKELAASGSLNSGYDGWGEIPIPFLNGLKIKVSFNNMKINAAHRAFEGEFSVERGGSPVPGMDFAGIRYDNLRFGVSTQRGGFYFDEGSHFALASPQHNTAGFPVSIGAFEPVFDMQGGNPRVGIRLKDLRISLSQGSGQNFSASTTITFYAVARNFRIDALDQLSIDFDGLAVSKIGVEGDVGGGIKLGGEIEFYSDPLPSGGKKDGVRGAANVTLPSLGAFNLFVEFGTVKNCTQCPDFNKTNQYYPYFSIEALVRLSSGITIFPGVALMGIGGGIWYNMEKLSEGQLPSAATLRNVPATDSSAQHGSASGRTLRFEPKWGTLGFSLRALFGPPAGGVYGLAVKVEVEVNTAIGALRYIAVGGDAFFLPEDQNNPDSAPITATCEFRLTNEGNNQFKFTGWLEVKLAYPRSQPLIRGAGDNYELVTATFYADDAMWHFYLGHMNPNGYDAQVGRNVGRAGMLVAIPGLRAEVSTYFMIGTPIPTDLPDLPPQVEEMLSGASAESRQKLGDQALSSDERENPYSDQPAGSGVAFGVHLYLGVEPNFAIFYASLKAWAGVDLMLVREPNLLCANGGNGLDGWRAKGQAYVGLQGEIGVGINIDWLCNDCRIPIINIYAAVALRAELPNPEYFVGRVGLGFEVLGGLVKGQCNFKMELGEKCNPDAADLGGIAFIGGMSPAKTVDCNQYERNINTFVSPSVSFNINMNETQSFIDDDGRNCKVKPKLLQCYVEHIAGNRVIMQKENWNTDHTVYTLEPASELPGLANFKFVVALGADKQCDNGSWAPVRSRGSEVVERAESCFRTGENAKSIPESNTRFTWPLKNQRFFISDEQGLYSFIKLKQWQSTLLDKPNTYDYYFRIKTLDGNVVGGANNKLPATISQVSFSIIYNMPPLEPQRTYAVQFIRKRKVNPNDPFRTSVKSIKAKLNTETNTYASGTEYASTDTITTRSLPDQIVLSGEELLYSYYFRTSQHRTILEKMNTVQLQNTQLASNTNASWLEVDMVMNGEGWEQYDLSGYTSNGTLQVEPLLDMTAPFDRFAQKQEANNKIYTPYNTRYLPAGIRYHFNFVPGIGWYRTDLLNSRLEPTTQVRIKRGGGFRVYLFTIPGEPPLDIDEITGQVQEEILHPRPILPPGAPGSIAPDQTTHSYTLLYETHKTVNQHRSQLLELYQNLLAAKLMSSVTPSLTFKLSGSVKDIYNWITDNHDSRKGDIKACDAMERFIKNPSHTLESHGMDYWNGLFRCETPSGPLGWDKHGLIVGAVQEHHRLTEAQFHTLRNSDRNNRTLLRSLQTPLLQRFSVGSGSYGVRFDFKIPTVGITSQGVSIPANIARIDRSFDYVGLLGNWALNANSGIFQNMNVPAFTGSNGTFPTPLNPPISTHIVLPPALLYPVTNLFQFSSFFSPHP